MKRVPLFFEDKLSKFRRILNLNPNQSDDSNLNHDIGKINIDLSMLLQDFDFKIL
jgi:hypothetical protein